MNPQQNPELGRRVRTRLVQFANSGLFFPVAVLELSEGGVGLTFIVGSSDSQLETGYVFAFSSTESAEEFYDFGTEPVRLRLHQFLKIVPGNNSIMVDANVEPTPLLRPLLDGTAERTRTV